ncbi:hypothetical protein M8037_30580 [Sinorhizobium meliloti]|uniref:hypothetical protein n=1 Tax=Rhizobium meliloti TaxID=382 RepID=UPI002074A174|nr:hypothetical protein [Sinorhizobium meliloti]MCM5693036.1 hypothetical protein [Sinorhizobium meliloti]
MIIVSIKCAVSVVGATQHEQILLRGLSLDIHRDDKLLIEWECPDERDSLKRLIAHGRGHVSGEVQFSNPRRQGIENYILRRIRRGKIHNIHLLEIGVDVSSLDRELQSTANFDAVVVFAPLGSNHNRTSFNRAFRLVDGRLLSLGG